MAQNATLLTPGVVLGHTDVQGDWPRDPEKLPVNEIDNGVFINELANTDHLPGKLEPLSDAEKKAFAQNPENLHRKAYEQGASPIEEGTYRGTQLALTKIYDLIEQRYLHSTFSAHRRWLICSAVLYPSWIQPTSSPWFRRL